jgi:hypothetical protein
VKLSGTWTGPLPAIGHYLRSPRGRFAYLIAGVGVHTKGQIEAGEIVQQTTRATFYVERIAATDPPAGATVHAWTWSARNPKHPRRP